MKRTASFLAGTAIAATLVFGAVPAPSAGAVTPGLNGKIAFSTARDGEFEIYVMNPDGSNQTNLTNDTGLPAAQKRRDSYPRWSPNGTKIAWTRGTPALDSDIYVMSANGSGRTQLTSDPAADAAPAWSPDGKKIAFVSRRDGNDEIYVMNADGTEQTRVTKTDSSEWGPEWSPDGEKIAFTGDASGHSEVYVMSVAHPDQVTQITTSSGADNPSWSPDGSKLAFSADYDDDIAFWDHNIYTADAKDGSGRNQLTNGGDLFPGGSDGDPKWSPDGTKIVFTSTRTGDAEVHSMNADGSGVTNLSQSQPPTGGVTSCDFMASWQPVFLLKPAPIGRP